MPGYDETIEIDVSTRSVGITSGFTGQRIVIFGAVHNSLQVSAEQDLYDVVIVVEGVKTPLISRRKSNVAGLWINTQSVQFKKVPSYYTISSSRPIEEISTPKVLNAHQIGFRHVRIIPVAADEGKLPKEQLAKFREALVRLKASEGLYQKHERGVDFIGKSLFRTTIDLPANVPIGPVVTRAYLFRDAELIAKNAAGVQLQRQGLEAWMHTFAFDYPLFYGLFAVAMAVSAGLAASAVFSRSGH
ncbi:MAG: TIGR02186 family protein [Alphaproteobacteria bacterium]|nr:TIGR02186 family protein [Alphaproteobacteria bacterium]